MGKGDVVRRVSLPGSATSSERASSEKGNTAVSPADPPTLVASLVIPLTPRYDSGRLLPTLARFRIWFSHLREVFGLQFFVVVSMVYFVQGFGSFNGLAVSFLMKVTLHMLPVESQAILTTAAFPWSIKPVFGILSDSLPLCGFRRKSYLIAINFLGCLATLLLHDVQAVMADVPPSVYSIGHRDE
ncbi:hypothetical protein H310_06289 [Aphanomyces invadans]|uniref:Uncharacterized protein n=1 Tax=Aphanomyces invadans TaxID=157072 RepID=A0A024U7S9_9STRA|nr:hypothetical protein H310_06289 [Aphanomyces invadans]ETW01668.1 hypothetical protein H310_06289 [Aphanomyces invadans]|eukprot:XP_008869516.1 hypothetical protein H310_06289 [Aphanomyces invadans]